MAQALAVRRAPLSVADVVVGCAPLGGMFKPIGDEVAVATIRKAVGLGFVNFDTAPHYALGLSETRLGEGLKQSGGSSTARVWTKVGRVVKDKAAVLESDQIEHTNVAGHPENIFPETPSGLVPVLDYSRQGVRTSFRDSCARLGSSQVHGLRVHDAESEERYDWLVSQGGLAGLVELREEGLIQDVSAGLNDAAFMLRLIKHAPNGTFNSVLLAGCWNLLDHTGLEVLLECQSRGIAVHNAGVYCSGLLVGGTTFRYAPAGADLVQRRDQWKAIADKHNVPLPAVAVAFAWAPQVVSHLVVGVRSEEELEQLASTIQQAAAVPAGVWDDARAAGLLPPHVPSPAQ